MYIYVPQKACAEKFLTLQPATGNNLNPIRKMDTQSSDCCKHNDRAKNLTTKEITLYDPTHLRNKTETVVGYQEVGGRLSSEMVVPGRGCSRVVRVPWFSIWLLITRYVQFVKNHWSTILWYGHSLNILYFSKTWKIHENIKSLLLCFHKSRGSDFYSWILNL